MEDGRNTEIDQVERGRGGKDKKLSIVSLIGLIIAVVALVLSAVPIINNFAAILAIVSLTLGVIGVVRSKKKSTGKGIGISAIAVSLLAIVIVFASQAMYGAAIDEASKSMDEEFSKITGDSTEELLKNDVSVEIGEFVSNTGEYGLVTTELPVKVTNKNAEAKSYSVQIEAVGADGQRIAEETLYANDLGSSQVQDFKVFEYVEPDKVEALKTAEFKIVKVTQS